MTRRPYDAWMRRAPSRRRALRGQRRRRAGRCGRRRRVGGDHRARAQRARGTGDPTAHAEVVALREAARARRRVAAGRLHAGRHARALHDVRGRRRPGPGRPARLRRRGPQGGRGRARCGTSCATVASTTAPRSSPGCSRTECAELLRDFFRSARADPLPDGGLARGSVRGPVTSSAVACPSGRRSTPRKRVRGQLLRGFKSHRHRQLGPRST